jgi:hypothetical protein
LQQPEEPLKSISSDYSKHTERNQVRNKENEPSTSNLSSKKSGLILWVLCLTVAFCGSGYMGLIYLAFGIQNISGADRLAELARQQAGEPAN